MRPTGFCGVLTHQDIEGGRRVGVIRRYMEFVKPYKWKIVLTVLIGIIKFSIPLVIPLLLKYVVDDIIQGSGTTEEKHPHYSW